MNNITIAGLGLFALASIICMSLLTFALLTVSVDHTADDAIRSRMDSLVNYTDQKINNNAERQDMINNGVEAHVRILDARLKLLQGRTQ